MRQTPGLLASVVAVHVFPRLAESLVKICNDMFLPGVLFAHEQVLLCSGSAVCDCSVLLEPRGSWLQPVGAHPLPAGSRTA